MDVRDANGGDGFTDPDGGRDHLHRPFQSNEISVKDIEKGEKIGVPTALAILVRAVRCRDRPR